METVESGKEEYLQTFPALTSSCLLFSYMSTTKRIIMMILSVKAIYFVLMSLNEGTVVFFVG